MIIQGFVFFLTATLAFCGPQLSYSEMFIRTKKCECGKSNELASRIVGGHKIDPHKYPWMVAIYRRNKFHCGGSLINDRYILTAGHCFPRTSAEDMTVVLGMHDKKDSPAAVPIDSFVVHEDFMSDNIHDINDIALIRLKNPVKFNKTVSPICLPKPGLSYVGKTAVVAGWGKTYERGSAPETLLGTGVTVLSNKDCKNAKIVGPHITSHMLCAFKEGTDACQGDSGGPLFYETEYGRIDLIGVVSWGIGCARPGIPGIYTRITEFLEWIALHTYDAVYCKTPS